MLPSIKPSHSTYSPSIVDVIEFKSSCYSMPVRTRGGLRIYPAWRGERVFQTPTGVKIRRVNDRYQYNPPTLKFTCVRILDRNFPCHRDHHLYAHVQSCVDKLVDLVEAHLNGFEWEGMPRVTSSEIDRI